jgi:hypothetical protein
MRSGAGAQTGNEIDFPACRIHTPQACGSQRREACGKNCGEDRPETRSP